MNEEQLQPPLEDPAKAPLTEEEKLAKLTEWWKVLDALANGNLFTAADFLMVLGELEEGSPTQCFLAQMDEFNIEEFVTAYNKVRAQFGAAFKEKAKKEMELRKEVASIWFPKPKEGTGNKAELPGGWTLKYTHKLDRIVVEEVLPAVVEQIRGLGVNPDPLTKITHAVSIKEYRALETLNKEAFKLFETALSIKPASPTLELVPPKVKETK